MQEIFFFHPSGRFEVPGVGTRGEGILDQCHRSMDGGHVQDISLPSLHYCGFLSASKSTEENAQHPPSTEDVAPSPSSSESSALPPCSTSSFITPGSSLDILSPPYSTEDVAMPPCSAKDIKPGWGYCIIFQRCRRDRLGTSSLGVQDPLLNLCALKYRRKTRAYDSHEPLHNITCLGSPDSHFCLISFTT